jgi:hypothetical protein
MPIATFSRTALFADDAFGAVALVDTNILVFTAILRLPNHRYVVLRFRAVGRLRCTPNPCPPAVQWCLDHGAIGGESSKASFESYLLSFRSSTFSNGAPPSVVHLVTPVFQELVGCVLSFRGRATQGASAKAGWAALLLFPHLVLRPMVDSTSAGHLPLDPVVDYRDNRLAHWATRYIVFRRSRSRIPYPWTDTATYFTSEGRYRPHVHFAALS